MNINFELEDEYDEEGEYIPLSKRECFIDEYVDLANDEYVRNGESAQFKFMQNLIARSKNIGYIIYFAKNVFGANIKLFDDAICNTNNAKVIFYYSYLVDNVDVNKLLDKLCEIGDGKYLAEFGINVLGKAQHIDKKSFDKILMALDNSKHILKKNFYKNELKKFLEEKNTECTLDKE